MGIFEILELMKVNNAEIIIIQDKGTIYKKDIEYYINLLEKSDYYDSSKK